MSKLKFVLRCFKKINGQSESNILLHQSESNILLQDIYFSLHKEKWTFRFLWKFSVLRAVSQEHRLLLSSLFKLRYEHFGAVKDDSGRTRGLILSRWWYCQR